MGAGASAQASHGSTDEAQTQIPIQEVVITPVELTANTTRALQRWREHAHLSKTIKCNIERPTAQKIMNRLGLELGDARGDVCTAIETMLQMTHLNLRLAAFRSHGSYGVVVDAVSASEEPLIVKLILLSEDGEDVNDISSIQFGNAVRIQRTLSDKRFVHLNLPELKDVLRIKIKNSLIGIEVMSYAKGGTAHDVLEKALANESDPAAAKAVVRLLAMALREFSAMGYVHGDPHLDNYLIDGDKVTLIDFDFASRSEETAVDIFKTLDSIGLVCKINGKLHVYESLVRAFIDALFNDNDETSTAFLSGLEAQDAADLHDKINQKMREDYRAYRYSLP